MRVLEMIPLPSFGLSAGSENGIDDGWMGGRIDERMDGWIYAARIAGKEQL